jgi:hypothetical protein
LEYLLFLLLYNLKAILIGRIRLYITHHSTKWDIPSRLSYFVNRYITLETKEGWVTMTSRCEYTVV